MTNKKKDIEYKVIVHSEYNIISNTPLSKEDILERLSTMLADGNIDIANEFFENANVVCKECGMSIQWFDEDSDKTIPTEYCAQCDTEIVKKRKAG